LPNIIKNYKATILIYGSIVELFYRLISSSTGICFITDLFRSNDVLFI